MRLKTKLLHIKLAVFGDRKFLKDGEKILPCSNCDKLFTSYIHYGDMSYIYDHMCEKCKSKL